MFSFFKNPIIYESVLLKIVSHFSLSKNKNALKIFEKKH